MSELSERMNKIILITLFSSYKTGLNDIIDSLKYVFNCFEFESADISILSNENNT
jgi:hypothetical protein